MGDGASRPVRSLVNLSLDLARAGDGNEMLMVSPPSGLGLAVSSAWWALAIAWTIERPSPCPLLWPVRAAPSLSKGWNRRPISSAGIVGPLLVIDRKGWRSRVPVVIST